MKNLKSKIILLILAVSLIGLLAGFLPTQAQTERDTIEIEFIQEIQRALELSVKYIADKPNVTLVYKSPSRVLREQADAIEQKEKDYDYILAVYTKLLLRYEGKNSR